MRQKGIRASRTVTKWSRLARKLLVHAEHAVGVSVFSHPVRYTQRDRAHNLSVTALREAVPFRIEDERLHDFYRRRIAPGEPIVPERTQPVYLVHCDDALFRAESGTVFSSNRHIVIDGDYYLRWKPDPAAFTGRLPKAVMHAEGVCASVWTGENRNYYHWLIDALLRLHSLELYGNPVTLLMPSSMTPMQHESLLRCMPANVTLRIVNEGDWYTVDHFLVPSFVTPHVFRYPPPDYLRWLQRRFFGDAGAPMRNGHRLYISREDAQRRRVRNEGDIVRMLASHGFRRYTLSGLAIPQQAALFRSASLIVGAHGAGLANTVFARRGIGLVELCTRDLDATFLETALAAQLRYHYLAPLEYGVLPEGARPKYAHSALRDADNTYDVDALEAIVLQSLSELA